MSTDIEEHRCDRGRFFEPGTGRRKEFRRRYRPARRHDLRVFLGAPTEASGVGRTLGPADGIRVDPPSTEGFTPIVALLGRYLEIEVPLKGSSGKTCRDGRVVPAHAGQVSECGR